MTTQAKDREALREWAEERRKEASENADLYDLSDDAEEESWQCEAAMYAAVIATLGDARRLDWLEATQGTEIQRTYCSGVPDERWWITAYDPDVAVNGKTLREAIDAAMATQEASNEQE